MKRTTLLIPRYLPYSMDKSGVTTLWCPGFALAEGSRVSCLSSALGTQLSALDSLPDPALLLVLCLLTSAVSQIASNSATVSMVLPVVLSTSTVLQVSTLYSVPLLYSRSVLCTQYIYCTPGLYSVLCTLLYAVSSTSTVLYSIPTR